MIVQGIKRSGRVSAIVGLVTVFGIVVLAEHLGYKRGFRDCRVVAALPGFEIQGYDSESIRIYYGIGCAEDYECRTNARMAAERRLAEVAAE